MRLAAICVVLCASTVAAAQAQPSSIDVGPQPSWNQAVQLGNSAIVSRLIDPDSARIAWPYAFIGGTLKALFGKTRAGWYTCGLVNARNRMGGFTGATPFLILIRDNEVQSLDIGEVDGEDTATVTCKDLAKKGMLHPSGASSMPSPVAPATATAVSPATAMAMFQQMVSVNEARGMESAKTGMARGGYGFSAVATPYGVSIMAVAPGSRAQAAGLKAGQDVLEVNGKSTIGMTNEQFLALLKSKPVDGFSLKISNGPDVRLPPL